MLRSGSALLAILPAAAALAACQPPADPARADSDLPLPPLAQTLAQTLARTAEPASEAPDLALDTGADRPLSVLFILTDDQRADAMGPMSETRARLGDEGMTFERAYVNTPLCCPARASIAAGGFLAMDTGVLTNEAPNGGNTRFDDSLALSVHLQGAGYRTAMIGKYVHGVEDRYVPPGWDWWVRTEADEDWSAFEVALGSSDDASSVSAPLRTVERYITEYLTAEAVQVIDDAGDAPFFIWLNHAAPHYPATPAEADVDAYDGEVWRGGAFDEADVSDKPDFVEDLPRLTASIIERYDATYQGAMESLFAVDRSVADLVDHLDEVGRLDDTVIIFASDNGMLWGEHRVYNKGVPWEEAVRVPLIVRTPGGSAGTSSALVSVATDVPATILDIAGVDAPTGGESLAPLLTHSATDWRETLLIEGYQGVTVPTFTGVVTDRWKYIRYLDGQEELYDLDADPYEERSLHDSLVHRTTRDDLAARVEASAGLGVELEPLTFTVGVPASTHLEAQAGTPPFTWLADTALPDGLRLDKDGHLHGLPTEVGSSPVRLRVLGSRSRAHDGAAEDIYVNLDVEISDRGGHLPPVSPPTISSLAGPPGPGGRPTATVEIRVPAPPGVPVSADLSGVADFDDAHHRAARGPDPVLRFEGLRPGTSYAVRIVGPAGVERVDLTTPPAPR